MTHKFVESTKSDGAFAGISKNNPEQRFVVGSWENTIVLTCGDATGFCVGCFPMCHRACTSIMYTKRSEGGQSTGYVHFFRLNILVLVGLQSS